MKVYIHKLGCPKNDVDADYIAARLNRDGHTLTSNPEEAETIVVNTCCFILPAREESIEEVLSLSTLKQNGCLKRLYLAGCMAQHHGDEMLTGMPEIDGAFGLGELDAISEAVGSATKLNHTIKTESRHLSYLAGGERMVTDQFPYAYLKISDGCNRGCTYCVIPQIRGSFRSRSTDDLVAEADQLALQGKRELILVSQEATLYGADLKPPQDLIGLLRKLEAIEDVRWIRPMYLHPAQVSGELIKYMTSENKTLEYFDLPLQHINSELLKAMRRQTDRGQIERLLDTIRSASNHAVIRATFIVGFPGETEAQFDELLTWIDHQCLDRVAGFVYSPEEGSGAASLADQVAEEEKNRRLDELMTLQQGIAFAKNTALIGGVKEVIIDAVIDGGPAEARTRGDCPEVDQKIFVTGAELAIGDIRKVLVETADGYDLCGTVIED
ncbi:MAG: 30S ribosomal protein S12 methylthiotransferase RimO [candidate division Zixibacteria bacterium]|nr:30S ribosomal protein S12 methylthiotransferase RimO [candidate division Zixibacteria bacterium]MDH3935817.1 30S ribosomal protein S12 methylthiotransferase RimO [candidate division Zixibacteria bacterium]MDH4032841.1 30S ribosomal protein S12 methylthiotransferase RimO [candidate division Zixibacteria bacterium]